MVKKSGEVPLKDLLNTYSSKDKLLPKIAVIRFKEFWVKTYGVDINNMTESIHYKNSIFTVKLNSAVLRAELNLSKTKVMEQVKLGLPSIPIEDVVFR